MVERAGDVVFLQNITKRDKQAKSILVLRDCERVKGKWGNDADKNALLGIFFYFSYLVSFHELSMSLSETSAEFLSPFEDLRRFFVFAKSFDGKKS
jgi:hypothetical protein